MKNALHWLRKMDDVDRRFIIDKLESDYPHIFYDIVSRKAPAYLKKAGTL
jgi:hypothetical protein